MVLLSDENVLLSKDGNVEVFDGHGQVCAECGAPATRCLKVIGSNTAVCTCDKHIQRNRKRVKELEKQLAAA